MASFPFDSGGSPVFGDVFAERKAPIGPSDNNSALLDRREWPSLEISLPELESVSQHQSKRFSLLLVSVDSSSVV